MIFVFAEAFSKNNWPSCFSLSLLSVFQHKIRCGITLTTGDVTVVRPWYPGFWLFSIICWMSSRSIINSWPFPLGYWKPTPFYLLTLFWRYHFRLQFHFIFEPLTYSCIRLAVAPFPTMPADPEDNFVGKPVKTLEENWSTAVLTMRV